MSALMTPRQKDYLNVLVDQRPVWAAGMSDLSDPDRFDLLTLDEASGFISLALSVPKENKAQVNESIAQEQIEEGSYWTHDGSVARVRKSKSSGRLYGEKLNGETSRFEYTKGLIFHLKDRMSLDDARAWGSRHGLCCVCAKTLTDNKSVDMGIGPVCIKRV